MSTDSDIQELAGAVAVTQEQVRKSSAQSGLPVLDMSQMMTSREYHRQLVAHRKASSPAPPPPAPGPRSHITEVVDDAMALLQRYEAKNLRDSVAPRSFDFTLATPNADLEAEVRRDLSFQIESAKYAKARDQWYAALLGSDGRAMDRRAIDRAGAELMMRYAAAHGAVYGVAIRSLKTDIARLQQRVEYLEVQETRLQTEARDHKQRADAFEIAHMTASPPPSIPDLKVTLNLPEEIAVRMAPSAGVEVEYDGDGKVVGTRPRGRGQ